MQTHCKHCGNELTAQQKKETIKAELKTFWDEGIKRQVEMIPYNDAFFEITKGQFKGNLVHIFNVIKH